MLEFHYDKCVLSFFTPEPVKLAVLLFHRAIGSPVGKESRGRAAAGAFR